LSNVLKFSIPIEPDNIRINLLLLSKQDVQRVLFSDHYHRAHPMHYPQFLDIEISTADEGGFPTSISWSLPDGQLKSVLIAPDDDWEPWDNADPSVDIQHLLDQGVSGPDVIRELNDDLDGQTIFVDGLDEDERVLELLFETYQQTLSFEVASMTQLFTQQNIESLLAIRNDIASELQFDLEVVDDNVRSLIFLYQQLNPS